MYWDKVRRMGRDRSRQAASRTGWLDEERTYLCRLPGAAAHADAPAPLPTACAGLPHHAAPHPVNHCSYSLLNHPPKSWPAVPRACPPTNSTRQPGNDTAASPASTTALISSASPASAAQGHSMLWLSRGERAAA